MLQKPSAILFDWDLTLANSFPALVRAYHFLLNHYNLEPLTDDQIKANTAYSRRELFPRLFGEENWEEASDIFSAHYAETHMEETHLLDGAYDLLLDLKDKYNVPFGVVSNKSSNFLRAEIEALGVNDMIDVIVGAGEAATDKPSPAPVLMAIEKLGLSSGKHIWYVGDSISDARAGMASGCTTIMIAKPDEAIALEKPEVYVASIPELRKLVFGEKSPSVAVTNVAKL